jgi:hypothetical protein
MAEVRKAFEIDIFGNPGSRLGGIYFTSMIL